MPTLGRLNLLMPNDLKIFTQWSLESSVFESFLQQEYGWKPSYFGQEKLQKSMQYSLFSGGKRFRPMLTLASCRALNKSFGTAIPWAAAVESIHTYSLIHDDLPCMDNDDERRGKPTNHIQFGEACALLAGDALLTDAFALLAQNYSSEEGLRNLIILLAEASGSQGMVGGQANDLFCEEKNKDALLAIHKGKTAALIRAACMGPFYLFKTEEDVILKMSVIAENIGVLFQLKDDQLDIHENDPANVYTVLGESYAQAFYETLYEETQKELSFLDSKIDIEWFLELLKYNHLRAH